MADEKHGALEHIWVLLLVGVVTLIFILSMVMFQVEQTEVAYVLRFKNPSRIAEPGYHFKWPWPIESIWSRDNRIQTFEGQKGIYEEMLTKDDKNIIVTTYVSWRIGHEQADIEKFLKGVNDFDDAKEKLTEIVRSERSSAIGRYNLSELVNTDADKVKIAELEVDILARVQQIAREQYGIEVTDMGIRHLGLPDVVVQKVTERMNADRERIRKRLLAEGKKEADKIRGQADSEAKIILARAENKAKKLRAEGDREAAESYKAFENEPELAIFLRKIDSIRRLASETTFVVGPETVPFDILHKGAVEFSPRGKPGDELLAPNEQE